MSLENSENADAAAAISTWLNEFQKTAAEELITNFGVLTAVQVEPALPAWSILSTSQLRNVFDYPMAATNLSIFIKGESTAVLAFTKKDAIWIGAIQDLQGEDKLQDKLAAGELDESDKAAFTEVCKQLTGSLERAAKTTAPDVAIQPADEIQIWENPDECSFPEDENYHVLLPIQANVQDRDPVAISILLSSSAIDELSGMQTEWQTLVTESDTTSHSTRTLAGLSALFIRLNGQVGREMEHLLDNQAISHAIVSDFGELRQLLSEHEIRLLVIQGRSQEELSIKLCRRIRDVFLDDSNALVWLQGEKWSPEHVKLAWNAGASYCIAEPLDRSLVENKILGYFEA